MSDVDVKSNKVDRKLDNKYRAYKFSLDIIKFCHGLPEKRVFWIIGDQLLRSATSIGANLVEAKASSSRRDFTRYYDIALKSANETKYWICLLKDSDLEGVNKSKIDILLEEVDQICRMIGKSIITLKNK